jgi:hypothetical protein
MREIGIHAVRDKKKLPSAMDSDVGETCGGGVEQDGSHESARRKREDHEATQQDEDCGKQGDTTSGAGDEKE